MGAEDRIIMTCTASDAVAITTSSSDNIAMEGSVENGVEITLTASSRVCLILCSEEAI